LAQQSVPERSFSLYEKEFPELVNKSIGFANGTKKKMIVVSIPDYAYTFVRLWKASSISYEIDNYFRKSIATKITLSLLALLYEKGLMDGTRGARRITPIRKPIHYL
jgi:hypothetical protein